LTSLSPGDPFIVNAMVDRGSIQRKLYQCLFNVCLANGKGNIQTWADISETNRKQLKTNLDGSQARKIRIFSSFQLRRNLLITCDCSGCNTRIRIQEVSQLTSKLLPTII
jgi:hypothetical protein